MPFHILEIKEFTWPLHKYILPFPLVSIRSSITSTKLQKWKKMKEMVDHEAISESAKLDEHSPDLRLDCPESKLELNLLDRLDTGSSKVLESSYHKKQSKKAGTIKFFLCKYCNKKFSNSQALGGHQNAHKRERAAKAMKREKGLGNLVTLDPLAATDGHFYPELPVAGSAGFSNHYGSFHALSQSQWCWPQFSKQISDDYWIQGGRRFQVQPPESIGMLANSEASTSRFGDSAEPNLSLNL